MQNSHMQTDSTQNDTCNQNDSIEEIPMNSPEPTETPKPTESKNLSNMQSQYLEKKLWDEKIKKEKIRVVISQTGYTEEEAIDKLTKLDWDCKKTIKFYLTGGNNSIHNHQSIHTDESSDNNREYTELSTQPSKNDLNRNTKNTKSINQQIYGEIRGLMDNASRNYYRKKERDAFMNEYLNRNVTKTNN